MLVQPVFDEGVAMTIGLVGCCLATTFLNLEVEWVEMIIGYGSGVSKSS